MLLHIGLGVELEARRLTFTNHVVQYEQQRQETSSRKSSSSLGFRFGVGEERRDVREGQERDHDDVQVSETSSISSYKELIRLNWVTGEFEPSLK